MAFENGEAPDNVSYINRALAGEMSSECLVCDEQVTGKEGLVVEVINLPEGMGLMLIHDTPKCHAEYARKIDAHIRKNLVKLHRKLTSGQN